MEKGFATVVVLCAVLVVGCSDKDTGSVSDMSQVRKAPDQIDRIDDESTDEPMDLCPEDVDFTEDSTGKYFLEQLKYDTSHYKSYPRDVKCYLDNAGACEHIAGEEPYDEERSKEIGRAILKLCGDAQNQSISLLKKYGSDAELVKILSICDTRPEAAKMRTGDAVCSSELDIDEKDLETNAEATETTTQTGE